jgi:hypothetical protein
MSLLDIHTSHAYFISGEPEIQIEHVVETIQKDTRFVYHFWKHHGQSLTIEHVHEAKKMAQSPQSEKEKTWILISGTTISHEAQNALLKLLEEPAPGTHVCIALPSYDQLIATVQSRLAVFPSKESQNRFDDVASEFLRHPYNERMKFVKKISDNLKGGNCSRFLDALENQVYTMHTQSQNPLQYASLLSEINTMQRYARQQGTVIGPLLEHIALLVPEE